MGNTLAVAWENSVTRIAEHPGELLSGSVGGAYYELPNVQIVAMAPDAQPRVSPLYPYPTLAESHRISPVSTSTEGRMLYDRIHAWPCGDTVIDQLAFARGRIERSLYTRAAAITIWNPSEDHGSDAPTCPTYLQFMVRPSDSGPRLQATAVVRSK